MNSVIDSNVVGQCIKLVTYEKIIDQYEGFKRIYESSEKLSQVEIDLPIEDKKISLMAIQTLVTLSYLFNENKNFAEVTITPNILMFYWGKFKAKYDVDLMNLLDLFQETNFIDMLDAEFILKLNQINDIEDDFYDLGMIFMAKLSKVFGFKIAFQNAVCVNQLEYIDAGGDVINAKSEYKNQFIFKLHYYVQNSLLSSIQSRFVLENNLFCLSILNMIRKAPIDETEATQLEEKYNTMTNEELELFCQNNASNIKLEDAFVFRNLTHISYLHENNLI